MKKFSPITAFVVVIAFLVLSSCNKEDVLVVQNVDGLSACIPASLYYGKTVYYDTLSQSEIQSAFAAAGVSYNHDRIKALKLKQVSAEISTNSVTTNFDEIGGFQLWAKGAETPNDSIQVAYIGDIASGTTKVTMKINGSELKELLHQSLIILSLSVDTKDKQGGHQAVCFKLVEGQLEYKIKAE